MTSPVASTDAKPSVKMWEFAVKNMRTNETVHFLGQGATMGDAWKDGYGNLGPTIANKRLTLAVTLADGLRVHRDQARFEGDTPYDPAKEKPLA